jgi:hypothetical protein
VILFHMKHRYMKRVSDTTYVGKTLNDLGQEVFIKVRKKKKEDKFPLTRHLQDVIFGKR